MSKPEIIEIIKLEKNTVNSEIFARVLPREMTKSLCRLLIKVKQALVAIFNVANTVCLLTLALFAKIKFSRKFPDIQ